MLALGLAGTTACGSAPAPAQEDLVVLEVAPETVRCVGEMVQRCLRVRGPGEEEWRNFYDPIEGFEHRDGTRYLLEVERSLVPDPPADAGAYRWRLVRILEEGPP